MTATSTKNLAQAQGRYRLLVRLCWIIWGCSGRQIHPKSELHRLQERLRRQEIGNSRRKLILTNTREICRMAECEKGHNASSKGEEVKIAMFGHKRVLSREGGSVIITLCSNMQSSTKNKEAAEKVEAKIHKSAEEFLK